MAKQRLATERAEKEPSMGEKEESDSSALAMTVRELMRDQQRQILMEIIEQQWTEMMRYRDEMKELLTRTEAGTGKEAMKVSLPKPTLQKLGSDDDMEHFLEMFEQTARQREWPEDVWAMQLAGLLKGKAMVAYANLSVGAASDYHSVKQAMLRWYQVNAEIHR